MNTANESTPHILTCWKDIANYMGKGVRTVQRWEQEFGLPVRRPLGSNKKAVLARPSDLDAWVTLRCGARNPLPTASGKHRDAGPRLAALSAHIQRTCQLRDRNRVLLDELQSALQSLRRQVLSLRQGVDGAQTAAGETASRCEATFQLPGEETCSPLALSRTASPLREFPEPTI
ncbi:MAG: hypothetical protein WCA44_03945 [Acidobacteriaceae bacterium]